MTILLSDLLTATRLAVIDGPGAIEPTVRRQVAAGQPPSDLASLVQKVRDHAFNVTDEDIKALRTRYSEDELFEIIIAAAIGAADDRIKAALAVLERA